MGGFYEGLAESLSLYVKQQAWLGTAPDKAKGEKFDSPPRIEAMLQRGDEIRLPPNPAEHLTRWLFDIGPAVPTGMASAPVGWRDIAAWQESTGVVLAPWEARMIRKLSAVFIAASRDARKRDCPAPYTGLETMDDVADRRAAVAAKLSAMFGGLKQTEA